MLSRWTRGDAQALERLTPLVYGELRQMARAIFSRELPGHTLQPTAVVHEAFLKLAEADVSWQDRAHFFALAARMMRRILMDHARAGNAQKRGGDAHLVTLGDSVSGGPSMDLRLFDLDRVLGELNGIDARKAELVELQIFGGLQVGEIAEVTGLSVSTVQRDLRFARAWLTARLREERE